MKQLERCLTIKKTDGTLISFENGEDGQVLITRSSRPGETVIMSADMIYIFPKNYLTGIGYTSDRDHNQIVNFTYLDYNTNIDISDDPPAEYVERYRKKLGEEGYKKTCEENALPVDFEKMSYPDFLEQCRK